MLLADPPNKGGGLRVLSKPGEGRSQVTSEQEIDREQDDSTCYLQGSCGQRSLNFRDSTLTGYFKRCPRKKRGGNWGWESYAQVPKGPDLGRGQGYHM